MSTLGDLLVRLGAWCRALVRRTPPRRGSAVDAPYRTPGAQAAPVEISASDLNSNRRPSDQWEVTTVTYGTVGDTPQEPPEGQVPYNDTYRVHSTRRRS